jgi:hypothetical protein
MVNGQHGLIPSMSKQLHEHVALRVKGKRALLWVKSEVGDAISRAMYG